MKPCIVDNCANACEKGRKYCREHYLERKREQTKARYKLRGRWKITIKCILCGKEVQACRRTQIFCMDCYKSTKKIGAIPKNSYENAHKAGYSWAHRRIAESVLNRKLQTNEVVHHLDGDPKNNSISNLIVINRDKHASLHNYLRLQGALLLKSNNEYFENCWKSLIVPMTTTWLETASVKVIKLWEIGQSAAEPLESEEGSETMHEAPKPIRHGDDIVQTTTA